jgi:hypothetical protein
MAKTLDYTLRGAITAFPADRLIRLEYWKDGERHFMWFGTTASFDFADQNNIRLWAAQCAALEGWGVQVPWHQASVAYSGRWSAPVLGVL